MATGETTSRKAAQQMCAEGFKIGSSTLRYQKRKHDGEAPRSVGRPTFLTSEEELQVVDWVKLQLQTYKLPVSKSALIAQVILALGDSVQERLPGGKQGKDWCTGCLRRHCSDLGTLATATLGSGCDDWCKPSTMNPQP